MIVEPGIIGKTNMETEKRNTVFGNEWNATHFVLTRSELNKIRKIFRKLLNITGSISEEVTYVRKQKYSK